jgi:hypothetical protein
VATLINRQAIWSEQWWNQNILQLRTIFYSVALVNKNDKATVTGVKTIKTKYCDLRNKSKSIYWNEFVSIADTNAQWTPYCLQKMK